MLTFEDLVVKKYENWTLHLHHDQYYLGRAYFWLGRPGKMQRFSILLINELAWLASACQKYEGALQDLWQPDHMNYAWLGNDFKTHHGHGHLHLIPRYKRTITFAGGRFNDENWGKNYVPYPQREYDDALLVQIRDALRERLK